MSNANATSNDILVRFENVQKSYDGETLVIKDLNLDMERGEFLTMLGPSGSGKTTLGRALAGIGALPPELGAWGANLLFLLLGLRALR